MYKFYSLIFIALFLSCTSKTKDKINEQKFGKINKSELGNLNNHITSTNHAKNLINIHLNESPLDISPLIDTVQLIPLETPGEALIGNIDKIGYFNNQFYILDKHKSKNLYIFNHKGEYINHIGKAGRGPGEYIEPSDFIVYPGKNEIVVFDHFGRQLLYYNLDGSYKNNVRLKYIITEIIQTANDSIFLARTGDNRHIEEIDGYELLAINREGKILAKMLKSPNRLNYINEFDYQYNDSSVLYHPAFSDKILSIKNNHIHIEYQLDIEDGLPQNFLNKCNGNYNNFVKLFEKKHNYPANRFFENEHYLFFSLVSKKEHTIHLYYDKTTREIISGIPAIQFGNNKHFDLAGIISFSLMNPFTISKNQIIGYILPIYLDSMPESERKKWFHKANIDSSESNPILFKLTLK